MSNTTKDEELKALELWESMFGNMAVAYAGSYVITCKEFLERIKRYGLEQRIEAHKGLLKAHAYTVIGAEAYAVDEIGKLTDQLTALKQKLTPEEQEKL